MRVIKVFSKLSFGLVVSLLGALFVLNNVAYAGQFYPGGYQRCLANSGGRQNFHSVQYACSEAVESGHGNGQNACASWLGSSASSTSQELWIYVTKGQTSAPIYVYGMCTDRPNTSAEMYTLFDGGSISVGNFTRGAPWGNVTSRAGSINIPAFKNGATVFTRGTTTIYFRAVGLIRGHSDYGSYDYDLYKIYVVESEGPPPVTNLCQAWMPDSYPNSNEYSGTTSMVVKVRNTAGRFGGAMSGAWHHNNANPTGEVGPIYAMPTDYIEWHSCYYPGVQATAKTDVSDINGTIVNGGADDMWQYEWSKSTYVYLPDGRENCQSHHPSVGYKDLWVGYSERIGQWQHRFKVGAALGSASGGDYEPGQYTWRTEFERNGGRGMGTHRGSDVGTILTQYAYTGSPVAASIGSDTPSHDIYDWVTHYRQMYDQQTIDLWMQLYGIDLSGVMEPYDVWEVVCTNSFSDDIRSASVNTGIAKDDATVIIPYNFKNSTGVEISGDPVYSGERVTVERAWVRVGTKYNNLTLADYATVVPKATVRMFMYVSSHSDGGGGEFTTGDASCNAINGKQCIKVGNDVNLTNLNAGGNLSGSDDDVNELRGTYNAFDASAGDFICFITAVNPYTSGADDATGDYAGDGMWRFGYPACQVISKKPTFQVWGGSLYARGSVKGNEAQKRNFYNNYFTSKTNLCKGSNCYRLNGGNITYLTSWVEEGLIIYNGTTNTVSSGAATGYNGALTRAGTTSNEFCKNRAPLSFSNGTTCATTPQSVGNSYMESGVAKRDDLIRYWLGNNDGAINWTTGAVNFANNPGTEIKTPTNMTLRYIHTNNSLSSVYGSVAKSKTYLVISEGDVAITGNIRYPTSGYTKLGDVPKVIIYARNINISCNVEEVDAILITKSGGKVNTCSQFSSDSDSSSSLRGSRLKIFGTVLTDKIYLGRTYGAAAWNGSQNGGKTTDAEAAEVFDYDSTIPMWSEFMGGSAETDTLQITYQHELAPRY